MKIALAQLNLCVGDIAGNTTRIIDTLRRARDEGSEDRPVRVERPEQFDLARDPGRLPRGRRGTAAEFKTLFSAGKRAPGTGRTGCLQCAFSVPPVLLRLSFDPRPFPAAAQRGSAPDGFSAEEEKATSKIGYSLISCALSKK